MNANDFSISFKDKDSSDRPLLWMRHAEQERAEAGAERIATQNPDLIVWVAEDPTVAQFPVAVFSIA